MPEPARGLLFRTALSADPNRFTSSGDAAPGYFYQAISNGFGIMNGYGAQIPDDRWAIVAYIPALH